jgi:S-adenosylmethionine:tRNA ribosyltransferase-isomerase
VGPDDFDYELPATAIAQVPVEPRDAARLLVSLAGGVAHRRVADLPELLAPGDVLVVNDTRVRPARLRLRRATGGMVEVLLIEARGEPGAATATWEALVRPSRKLPPGTRIEVPGLVVVIGEQLGGGRRRVELRGSFEAHGVVPLPPYIRAPLADPERYQTVYAREPGSAAAPTAGLHLTRDVLARCREAGAEVVSIELAVGLDTFKPIAVDDLDEHVMHTERYVVPASTMEACASARRVVAVGTTTVRALESAARGELAGRTDLFIRSPFEFKVVDLLLTNLHFPRSTLLVLLDAFIGPRWRELYELALTEQYRFLSFGDAMLVGRRSA